MRTAIPETLETVKQRLEVAYSLAQEARDYDAIDRIGMDIAKLSGLLVDRREVTTIDDGSRSAMRSLITPCLPKTYDTNVS